MSDVSEPPISKTSKHLKAKMKKKKASYSAASIDGIGHNKEAE